MHEVMIVSVYPRTYPEHFLENNVGEIDKPRLRGRRLRVNLALNQRREKVDNLHIARTLAEGNDVVVDPIEIESPRREELWGVSMYPREVARIFYLAFRLQSVFWKKTRAQHRGPVASSTTRLLGGTTERVGGKRTSGSGCSGSTFSFPATFVERFAPRTFMSDVGIGPDDFEVEASNGGDMVGLTVVKQLNIEILHTDDDRPSFTWAGARGYHLVGFRICLQHNEFGQKKRCFFGGKPTTHVIMHGAIQQQGAHISPERTFTTTYNFAVSDAVHGCYPGQTYDNDISLRVRGVSMKAVGSADKPPLSTKPGSWRDELELESLHMTLLVGQGLRRWS
ncbi:hypothetical protein IMY05_C4540000800 [Salix suchowensis]|nr:hypothetical protein IMY05_C4540000800 [Salix suchowensis]